MAMTEGSNSTTSCWYQGLDALLQGDEALAQDIWMSAMLDSPVDDVDDRTEELLKLLENTAIELLHVKEYNKAKQCYDMALDINPDFTNQTLSKILLWPDHYTQSCDEKGYQFATDWFSFNIPIWKHVLRKFIGSPNLSFLEVGSWEGRSTCWLLDNILTDESSTITCIDTFQGSIEHIPMGLGENLQSLEAVFDHNIQQTGKAKQVTKLVGFSQALLRQLPVNTFDVYYVDGSHIAADVLEDTVLGWRLVKEGGLIIFDDYGWEIYRDQPTLHPKLAVDAFLAVFQGKVNVLHQGYQVICEKTQH